ncbi:MAG TPA: CoA pyrophosphatase [Cyclobacteriaceae bacterium]|jgi:8-oxo-dGTP pyrophosphatase MutT (NUDIX family)|nr:CoA pyrophosphatase [Cyclobacteriaceae bacterium]
MNFVTLSEKLSKRLTLPLPGSIAHEPVRATPVGPVRPKFEHKLPPKPGSVLILLYEDEGKIKFPLTKRPEYLGAHAGQISLPGGKAEAGESYLQTALREGEEEIGIHSNELNVIGRLSEFFVIPSNYLVVPVIAYSLTKPKFIPQESEVVKILEGDLDELVRDDAIQTKEILAAKMYPMLAPHFLIEGEIVWGATAMMLNEFRVIVREVLVS